MKHLHGLARKAGLIFLTAATVFSLAIAYAAESGDKKAGPAPPPPPPVKGVATPVKKEPIAKEGAETAKKKVSKVRKKARHNPAVNTRETEPDPGARLTLKQVMGILDSTGNFSGKNLSGLRLVGFDLSGCNFKGADLSHANMERANLQGANLELADLTGANLMMTDLRLTGLKGVRLDGAAFDGAIWQDGTTCSRYSIGYCREQSGPSGSN
jgi:hypothetical protein